MSTPFESAIGQLSPLQAAVAQLSTLASSTAETISGAALDRFNIVRPRLATDDYGAQVTVYETVNAEPVPCNWTASSASKDAGTEHMVAGQLRAVAWYKITDIPIATDVKQQDRLVILARGTEPQHTFEVKTVIRISNMPFQVNCTLEE